jgi:hypothetical protein
MNHRSGIKLLAEIEGFGEQIKDNDRCDAVLKFYRNQGDPLIMKTYLSEPTPKIVENEEGIAIAWEQPELVDSHIVFERSMSVSRGADILPGIYYTLLGMRSGGYRHVAIPPHLYSHSMHDLHGIDKDSIIKLECFVSRRI